MFSKKPNISPCIVCGKPTIGTIGNPAPYCGDCLIRAMTEEQREIFYKKSI